MNMTTPTSGGAPYKSTSKYAATKVTPGVEDESGGGSEDE